MASVLNDLLQLLPLLGAGGQGFVQGRQQRQAYQMGEQNMELAAQRGQREQDMFELQKQLMQGQLALQPFQQRAARQGAASLPRAAAEALFQDLGAGQVPPGYEEELSAERFLPLVGARGARQELESLRADTRLRLGRSAQDIRLIMGNANLRMQESMLLGRLESAWARTLAQAAQAYDPELAAEARAQLQAIEAQQQALSRGALGRAQNLMEEGAYKQSGQRRPSEATSGPPALNIQIQAPPPQPR